MLRNIATCIAVVLPLAASAPAFSFSLVSLEPSERDAMLTTCRHLRGGDQALCRDVVNDDNLVANAKRSCLHAMTLMLQGSAWAAIKSLPPAVACREGLQRAGYPVNDISRRLAGATSAQR